MLRKFTSLTASAVVPALFAFLAFLPGKVSAFHIIGGDITYRCVGPGPNGTMIYDFVMTQYRDCAGLGAQFDNPAEIGVYRLVNGVYTFVLADSVGHGAIQTVPPPNDPCLIIPSNVCVERAVYQFTLNLPVVNGSYLIFWRRCCRNESINNIVNPRDVGATFSVEITARAQQVCNDSPRFTGFPPTVICVNQPLMFDHSAMDSEGDQLVYEFCAPLEGGGPIGGSGGSGNERSCNGIRPNPANCPPPFDPVTFIGPTYTAINPLAGNPKVTINSVTGQITGTPTILGQFVVGVCVKEYRNGELLSTLQRDFQFNVSTCQIAVTAEIAADTMLQGQRFVINSCGENTVNFINQSERIQNIINYDWQFDLGNEIQTFTSRDATVTFPGLGTYPGTMIVNKGLTCTDTASILVNIYPAIDSDFEFEYDTCHGAPVSFTDLSISGSKNITNWFWSFGDGETSQARNPDHLYLIPGNHEVRLRVRDINLCEDESMQVIPYFPAPPIIVVEPSTFNGCAPASVFFNNLSIPIDETYDIRWEFGDGGTSTEISPTYIYSEEGLYSLRVSITSPIGCEISADFGSWINIRPSPEAGFSYSPQELTSFQSQVAFTDLSQFAVSWQWAFGDENISFLRNPTYTFVDTGIQHVRQVVFHENGCTDTAFAVLDVVPEVRYFLPNAFTPNYDSRNDSYLGVGVLDGIQDFELSIWSRWGERVFFTTDPLIGWNGTKENSGEELPSGVYVCVVKYKDPRNNPVEIKEFATLIR